MGGGKGRCTVTMVSDAPAIPPARSLRAIGGLLSVLSMLFTFDHTVCDETQIKEVQECGREVINFERQDEMQGRNLRVLLLPTIVQKYRYRALIARLILFTLNSALFSKSVAGTFTERCIAKRLKLSTDNYNAITFKTEKIFVAILNPSNPPLFGAQKHVFLEKTHLGSISILPKTQQRLTKNVRKTT